MGNFSKQLWGDSDERRHRLIGLAGAKGWLAKDVVDYAHVLRNHRNLVHPNKQHTDGHTPDGDTVMIAWNVVVAAINDLAAFDARLADT